MGGRRQPRPGACLPSLSPLLPCPVLLHSALAQPSISSRVHHAGAICRSVLHIPPHQRQHPCCAADFLYVPAYTSCLITPVQRTADSLRDMWYGIENLRVHAATHMLLEAYYWIKAHAPYWWVDLGSPPGPRVPACWAFLSWLGLLGLLGLLGGRPAGLLWRAGPSGGSQRLGVGRKRMCCSEHVGGTPPSRHVSESGGDA